MKNLMNGIFKENPIFVLFLGMCPALAVTTKVESAYVMGICVFLVLLFSNIVISVIKKIVPDSVRIPVYIIIIGTFVTILEMLLKYYAPALYSVLGIYLPLIVVNCIVLGRALAVASKQSVGKSMMDALGIGIGFTLSLTLIALIREVLGNNTLTLMDGLSAVTGYRAIYQIFPIGELFPIPLLTQPAGAFLIVGILLAIFQWIGKRRHERHESH